jgi:hypothetical protein
MNFLCSLCVPIAIGTLRLIDLDFFYTIELTNGINYLEQL